MTADKLTPEMHLRGLLWREVAPGFYAEEVPVVRRVRRRCRCHRLIRIDVTWTTGGRCRYQPTDQVEVLP